MANLIKRIAVSTSHRTGQADIAEEFKSSSNLSTSGKKSTNGTAKRGSVHELSSIISYTSASRNRAGSFTATGNQIKTTQEISVTSEPRVWGRRGSEVEITGAFATAKANVPGVIIEESITRSKSEASSVEIAESLKSAGADVQKRTEDSDDEAALVGRGKGWGRVTPR
jgi:hypothetical protein